MCTLCNYHLKINIEKKGYPRDCHTDWNKPDRERAITYDIAYIWNLKKKNYTNELTYKTETDW